MNTAWELIWKKDERDKEFLEGLLKQMSNKRVLYGRYYRRNPWRLNRTEVQVLFRTERMRTWTILDSSRPWITVKDARSMISAMYQVYHLTRTGF